jgi:Na+-translocating ferredoxin:NAD+ oxidoreductase RnfC subunit
MNKAEVLKKVRAAGIVGAGGAGFPTAVKLEAEPEYILVNGAECEPLLRVDQALIESQTPRLLSALSALVEATGAREGLFATKEHYQGAVAALSRELPAFQNLRLVTLGNFYPMGDEQVLVYEALNRIVPEGGLPLARGVLVLNVETLLNVGLALDEERPVLEKYVTVTGAVREPATFKVPLGLAYGELVAAAGGATVPEPALISGGPMMGRLETTGRLESGHNVPVTKTTKGLIVLARDHPLVLAKSRSISEMMRLARAACCHCMLCTDLCPRALLGHRLYPDKLMRLAAYGAAGENPAAAAGAFLCCECGLCEMACIMGLQPWRLNRELKKRLGDLGLKNPHQGEPAAVNPFRAWRQYPIPKLIRMTGLSAYEGRAAPLRDYPGRVTAARLPLKQHLGPPAIPRVSLGEAVALGQLVAAPAEGALGANIHASLAGRVADLDQTSIVIKKDGYA